MNLSLKQILPYSLLNNTIRRMPYAVRRAGTNATSIINFIIVNFHLNKNYSILMKFGFKGNSLFYMSGKQIGLKYLTQKF